MTIPRINSVGFEIAYHAIAPVRQLLRSKRVVAETVDPVAGSLVRQLDNWRESSKNTGRLGPYENLTLSAEDAEVVYGAFDNAFETTFHGLEVLGRREASSFVKHLVLDVSAGLKSICITEESDKILLQDFLAKCEDQLEDIEVRPTTN